MGLSINAGPLRVRAEGEIAAARVSLSDGCSFSNLNLSQFTRVGAD